MVGHGQETIICAGSDVCLKKKELLSSAMKRTSEWISSQEIASDINVQIGEATFLLHKVEHKLLLGRNLRHFQGLKLEEEKIVIIMVRKICQRMMDHRQKGRRRGGLTWSK